MNHLGPAGIWDDSRATKGSNANGSWVKRPDGVLEQTGSVTLSSGAATITFPVPFTVADPFVELTPIAGSALAATVTISAFLQAVATKTGASVMGRQTSTTVGSAVSAGTFAVRWRAVGP